MKLIPTKRQWKKWSLPSKVSYISFWLAVISLLIVVVQILSPENDEKPIEKNLLGSITKSPWMGFEIIQNNEVQPMFKLSENEYPDHSLRVDLDPAPFTIVFPTLEKTKYGYGAIGIHVAETDFMFKKEALGKKFDLNQKVDFFGLGLASSLYGNDELYLSPIEVDQGRGYNYLTSGERLDSSNDKFESVRVSSIIDTEKDPSKNLIKPESSFFITFIHGNIISPPDDGPIKIKRKHLNYLKINFRKN